MSRRKRTEADLVQVSEHLHYEFSMLTSIAGGLSSGIAGQSPMLNAMLESFVIHMRSITEFLYNDNPRSDDVIADDFFEKPGKWRELRPRQSELLRISKERAGKEIAHLTYGRLDVTPDTKPWPFIEISNEITQIMNTFIDHVPEARLGPRWK
jgi:hypothetical protein